MSPGAGPEPTAAGGRPLSQGTGPADTSLGPPRDERPPPHRPVVAVDAMGGDHAPAAIVAGAVTAVRAHGAHVVLTGRPGLLRPLLARHGAAADIPVIPAEEAVGMDEGALASFRRPQSSIAIACQLIRRGQAAAVMSAGSTGAIVATARLRLRPLPGVARPALAVVLPTVPEPTLLLDAGAIADPRPEMLVQFAQLGVAYAQVACGIAEPLVGLLSIGAEPSKGNKLALRAHELLAGDPPHGGLPINFVGNVEGGDLLAGTVNVVVTDGFTGNVALKTLEGTAAFTARQFRAALGGSAPARLGTVLQRRGLRELSERLDTETYGGAALLGLEGTVVIAHGAVADRGAAAAIALAGRLADAGITDKIRERLGPGMGRHFLRRP
jgi:phosphate acyltransferase